jgi:opacity protein-like surface antigen
VRALLLTVLLLAALASGAAGQTEWVFLADGELSFLAAGPDGLTDRYSQTGYGTGLGLGAILSKSVMVLVQLNYLYVPIDEDGFRKADDLPDDATLQGGDLNHVYLSVGARYNLLNNSPLKIKPYLVGGVGWYYVETDAVTGQSSSLGPISGAGGSQNVVGFNIGVGFDFPIVSTVNGFVEAQYQIGLTKGSEESAASDGGSESTAMIPVRLGLAFLLGQ